jgi:transposase
LVFVDESGTHIALTRLYGWAPHDQRATGSVPRNRGKNTTLVAALTPNGLQVPWMVEGAMESATFTWYITEHLGPTLRPGQVVVLDNLSVHKAARLREALAARGCALLFLPPYSPDCTPIEQAFSKLTAILRGLGSRTREALVEAVGGPWRQSLALMRSPGSPLLAPPWLIREIASCSRCGSFLREWDTSRAK